MFQSTPLSIPFQSCTKLAFGATLYFTSLLLLYHFFYKTSRLQLLATRTSAKSLQEFKSNHTIGLTNSDIWIILYL